MTKSIVIIASVFLCISCNKNTDDIGSVVEVKGIVIHITDPKKNSRNIEDSLLQIKVDATDPQKKISKISLYIDHKLIASVNKSPYQYI